MGQKKGQGLMRSDKGWGDDYSEYHGYIPQDGYYKGGTPYKVKKGWDTGDAPKVCENCDWMPKTQKQKITVDYEVWKSLMTICTKIKVEWQALLTGEIDTQGVVHVTGYFIPKQEVTSSSVKNLELIDDVVIAEKRIVAGVHSHANMACFFSSTDHDDTNMSLIKHHIVVNNNSQYKAQSRVELPCGMVKFIEAEVFTVGDSTTEITGLENITERSMGFVTTDSSTYTPWKPKDKEDDVIDGIRWCPICDGAPEEDGGVQCVCWTKGKRLMLPDFNKESYVLKYGRSWELKPNLLDKFSGSH